MAGETPKWQEHFSFTPIVMPFWRGAPPFTEDSCDKKSSGAEKEKGINNDLTGGVTGDTLSV